MDYNEAVRLLHPDTTREALFDMDSEEAIQKIDEACIVACNAIDELQKYQQIGSINEVKEAMKKRRKRNQIRVRIL